MLVRTDPGAADDAWCARLRGPVAQRLLDLGVPGLAVNVKDAEVRASLMTLTVLDPPVTAAVSVITAETVRMVAMNANGTSFRGFAASPAGTPVTS